MKDEKIRILYIDDEEHNLVSFNACFRKHYDIHTAISAKEGKKILEKYNSAKALEAAKPEERKDIQIIITDQRMPDISGVDFLASILDEYPDAIRILLTGYSDIEAVIDAINKGHIFRYITKPWNEYELKMTIENAFQYYALKQENKQLMRILIQTNKQLEFMLRQKLLS